MRRSGERGGAILMAMLTVVLVATLAASTLWQQWRGVEIEAAERARIQSSWVLTGALDWARLILREDGRTGGADHLAEPWALPLEQARLSSFLAADRSDALAADEALDAFVSGQILDLQARLNISNLVQGGKVDEPSRRAFRRLFELLNLPLGELDRMVDALLLMNSAASEDAGADLPLWPQEPEQLTWLGLSSSTVHALRAFITILPMPTPVNLNTASAEVIYACVENFELADASRFVRERGALHLAQLSDAVKLAGGPASAISDKQHSVSTRYFDVYGKLQVDQVVVRARSIVQRDGMEVRTVTRRRGVISPGAALQ